MQKTNLKNPSYNQLTFNNQVQSVFDSLGGVRTLAATQQVTIKANSGLFIDSLGSVPTTDTPLSGPLRSSAIGVSLEIGKLINVEVTSPQNENVLVYSSARGKWINKAGLSGLSTPITALSDVDFNTLNGRENQILRVNSTGTSITTVPDNYVDGSQLIDGAGIIFNRPTTNGLRADLNPNTITEEFNTNNISDFFINTNRNIFSKIKQSTIDVTKFAPGSDPYIQKSNFNVGHGLSISGTGMSITFSLSTGFLNISLGHATGTLSIGHGGTAATTSAGARTNLEVDYNVHVLSVFGPSFRDRLSGDNIILQPHKFTVSSIGRTGSDYETGDAFLFDLRNPTAQLSVRISSTGSNGGVSIGNLDLSEHTLVSRSGKHFTVPGVYVLHGINGGSGASFHITPEAQYINFGPSAGVSGFGIRNKNGVVEFKNSPLYTGGGASWTQILPLTLSSRLADVTFNSGTSQGAVLLYNGSEFAITNLSGGISSIGPTGNVGLCLASNSINELRGISPGVSFENINNIHNLTENIMDLLGQKLGISPLNALQGDLVYYNARPAGTSTFLPVHLGQPHQILGVPSSGTSIPTYSFADDYFGTSAGHISTDAGTRIPVFSYGLSRCPLYTLQDFFSPLVNGSSSGLHYNTTRTRLVTCINNLEVTNSFDETYSLAINKGDPVTDLDKQITVTNFNTRIAGRGLCAIGGPSISIGDLDYIQFTPLTYGASRTVFIPKTGAMAYFKDSVNNNLAVYNGLCWMTLQFGPSIVFVP